MEKRSGDGRFFLWLGLIGTAGSVLVFFLSRQWGLGVSALSVCYTEAARNFISGLGFAVFSKGGTVESLVAYPPGFPFLLSWGWFLGMDAFHWARILNVIFFGINIFLAGILAWSWSRSRVAGWVAAGLLLVSPHALGIHLHLLSEPVALSCLLFFFISLSRYEQGGSRKMFYAAAVAALLAGLLKPFEAAFIVSAWAVFFSVKTEDVRAKAIKAGLFFLIAASCSLLWYAPGILTGRISWTEYPLSLSRIYIFLDLFSTWILPEVVSDIVRWIVMGLVLGGIVFLWKARKKLFKGSDLLVFGRSGAFVFMLASFLSCFFIVPLFPSQKMMVPAVLFPILVLLLILMACVAVRVENRKMAAVILGGFLLLSAGRSVYLGNSFFHDGQGYSSRGWTESKVLKELRSLDERVTVYTNDPKAIYYLTGRSGIAIPQRGEDDGFFPLISSASLMFERRLAIAVIFEEKGFLPGTKWQDLMVAARLQKVMSDPVASIYVQKREPGATGSSAR